MINFIKNFLYPKPKFLTDSKYRIIPAFELDGVTYYEFEDVFNTPCTRALSAIKYYEEMRMKCTIEYLQAWSEAQANVIKQAEDDLTIPRNNRLNLNSLLERLSTLEQYNTRLNERLSLAIDVDLVYKLASVVYFDATENPSVYEMNYGMKKVEKWKRAEDMESFFLRQPIKKLVPFLDGQEANIQTYSEVVEKIKTQDWKEVLENLSKAQKMKYTKALS